MDYCVGIGNDGGGKLILGVTNTPPREVVGTPAVGDTQEMQKRILDRQYDCRKAIPRHASGQCDRG